MYRKKKRDLEFIAKTCVVIAISGIALNILAKSSISVSFFLGLFRLQVLIGGFPCFVYVAAIVLSMLAGSGSKKCCYAALLFYAVVFFAAEQGFELVAVLMLILTTLMLIVIDDLEAFRELDGYPCFLPKELTDEEILARINHNDKTHHTGV
ncbi:MAG: hypothetical protein QM689_06760 [Oscillospiraceae bacterium]